MVGGKVLSRLGTAQEKQHVKFLGFKQTSDYAIFKSLLHITIVLGFGVVKKPAFQQFGLCKSLKGSVLLVLISHISRGRIICNFGLIENKYHGLQLL